MEPAAIRRLLAGQDHTDLDCYALFDASTVFEDPHLQRLITADSTVKHLLFTGENSWMLDDVGPILMPLNQPELPPGSIDRLIERIWGRGHGIFLSAGNDVDGLVSHLRRFFQVRADNNRDVYFRYYDPAVLRIFLPLLDARETIQFMGPVNRFLYEDLQGKPLVVDRPVGGVAPDRPVKPAAILFDEKKRAALHGQWNAFLFKQHAAAYEKQGLTVAADPEGLSLTLSDKAGGKVRLQKTPKGVTAVTGEARVFDYTLSRCKHPVGVTDPAGTIFEFDIQERRNLAERQPDSEEVTDSEPGIPLLNAIRMADQHKAWTFEYDQKHQLERIDYPDGTFDTVVHDPYGNLTGFTDRNGYSTALERDFNERVTRIIDARGRQTDFTYGDLTAPETIAFADGRTFNFSYTPAGALETFSAGDNQVTAYAVDTEDGRLSIDYADGTTAAFKTAGDRIVEAVNEAGTLTLTYDAAGRPSSETFNGRTVTYYRDPAGRLIGITTPFGETIHYQRDREGRVCAITDWDGHSLAIGYHQSGVLATIDYPNGARLEHTADALGLPSQMRLIDAQGKAVFNKVFDRDPMGRVTAVLDGDNRTTYTYDPEGRLLRAESTTAALNEQFQLDEKANRLADNNRRYTIDAADKVAVANGMPFTHDALGNLTQGYLSRGETTFTYTALNRIKTAENRRSRARYQYDALGRRVTKEVDGVVTTYIWAGSQLLHEVCWDKLTDAGTAQTIDYLFFPETPIMLAMRHERQTCWAAFGHRYETLCLTDATGTPVWQAEYDAFGGAHISLGIDLFQPFRQAGQYSDPESGLHYNLARYYDPQSGRYLSPDPLFLEGGSTNFYVYCNGDPINHIDPDGQFIFIPILIGAAVGAAILGGIEAARQHKAGSGMDGFKIAKAALLGAAVGAVGSGVGLAVEAAVAGTALGASTLAAMGATGFLSGTASSVAEQCAEAAARGTDINPMDVARQSLTDGVIGAGASLVTLGLGGFFGRTIRKTTQRFAPLLPTERVAKLASGAKQKARDLTARIKSSGAGKNGRSNDFNVGDPVNPVTGEVVLTQGDFTLHGRVPLTWTRQYGSQCDYNGLLGRGWQSPADARLTLEPSAPGNDSCVVFYDGTPKAAVFEKLPAEEPIMEVVDGAVLETAGDHYTIRLKSGITFYFNRSFTDNSSPVTRITTPDGHHLRFVRENGQLVRIEDDAGQCVDILTKNGRILHMTQGGNTLVRYTYHDGCLISAVDALGAPKRFFYEDGRLSRHMDKNRVSFYYRYDDQGRCVHTTGDGGLYARRLEYPPFERCTRVTEEPDNRRTTFYYNPDKLPIKVIDPAGGETVYEYDDVGRVIKVVDPLQRASQYDYDQAGNLLQIIRPDSSTMAFAYDQNHRLIQAIDPNGKIWEQRYDRQGRLKEKIDPLDNRASYQYNSSGDLELAVDAMGHATRFEWDEKGRLSAIITPQGQTTRYQHDGRGNVTTAVDPAGQTIHYVYDKKNRLIRVTQPSGAERAFVYDPEDNLTLYTDPVGNPTRFEYGGLNEIVKRIDADGTTVNYRYDSEERLIAVTNQCGQHYQINYDPVGRPVSQTDYHGHTTRYEYDSAGQLIRSTDPLNRIITYDYDPVGRLQAKTFENEEQEFFSWDPAGNLTSFQSPAALVDRFYDAAGNLIAEKNGESTVQYQYDGNGRRTLRATNNGNRVAYGYDNRGLVNFIHINDELPLTIDRNHQGQITAEHFSRYLERTFDYDADGRLSRQTITGVSGRIHRSYTYDPAGNLIAKHDSLKGHRHYTYDPMGRITQSVDPENQIEEMLYDPAGDLLKHLPDSNTGLRRAEYNHTRYTFDAAGNLVERRSRDDTARLVWDDQNRLTSVRSSTDDKITFTYDALGRRRQKNVNGNRTTFTWDGNALLTEQNEDGAVREYVYYPGTFEPLALIDADGQVYYYHNDINGLPQELTRYNGDIVWAADYDALGRVEKLLVEDVVQPLRMQGQYYDQETGLCYNRYRYLDPNICSFISQDPIGIAAGENVYAYAPNVWGWVDPLGLCKDSRPTTGSSGNTVSIASDFIGNKREIGKSPLANLFYSVPNKGGGRVFVSIDEINQLDFMRIVNPKNAKSKVTVLTGTHGDLDGNLIPELDFFYEDIGKWGSRKKVNVIDITKMNDSQISIAINSSDRVICAWCFSERSSTVLKALGFI